MRKSFGRRCDGLWMRTVVIGPNKTLMCNWYHKIDFYLNDFGSRFFFEENIVYLMRYTPNIGRVCDAVGILNHSFIL